jgi:hypothetical protein
MHYSGQWSDAILWLFFLLLNHKLRAGRMLVKRLKQFEPAAS